MHPVFVNFYGPSEDDADVRDDGDDTDFSSDEDSADGKDDNPPLYRPLRLLSRPTSLWTTCWTASPGNSFFVIWRLTCLLQWFLRGTLRYQAKRWLSSLRKNHCDHKIGVTSALELHTDYAPAPERYRPSMARRFGRQAFTLLHEPP